MYFRRLKMSKEIKFVCQKCDAGEDSRIEEVQAEMTVTTEIDVLDSYDDGHVEVQYGDERNEDGHVVRYQCKKCGFLIVDSDSEHAEDGLDEHALVKAIEALNAVREAKGEVVGCDALLNQISEAHENLDGGELAELFNNLFPGQKVKYLGDSMFEVVS